MPFPAKYPGVSTVPKRIPVRLLYVLMHKFIPWMLKQESGYGVAKVALVNLDEVKVYRLHGKSVIRLEDIESQGVITMFCTAELDKSSGSTGEGES